MVSSAHVDRRVGLAQATWPFRRVSDGSVEAEVAEIWAPRDLRARVAEILAAAGKDASNTSVEDLQTLDHYHTGGVQATLRLAHKAGIAEGQEVLDVGSGLGGPARMLASRFSCRVTGVDISAAFLETAELFTEITGLQDRVSFREASATALPFADQSFDVVWTQHVAQSVADKRAFFGEMVRVLKTGGVLVLHDLYRGEGAVEFTYPAVFDRDGSITFLSTAAEVRGIVRDELGVEFDSWDDCTAETRAWTVGIMDLHQSASPAPQAPIPGLDRSILFGAEDRVVMMKNALADIDSGATGFFEAIGTKVESPAT